MGWLRIVSGSAIRESGKRCFFHLWGVESSIGLSQQEKHEAGSRVKMALMIIGVSYLDTFPETKSRLENWWLKNESTFWDGQFSWANC